VKIRGKAFPLAQKELLLPEAARSAVVVIARNDQDRDAQLADRAAGGYNRGFAWGWRIEYVAGNNDELDAMASGNLADSFDGAEALSLERGAFLDVNDASERFAQLPVSGMEEASVHGCSNESPFIPVSPAKSTATRWRLRGKRANWRNPSIF
jgi:hypothetical protein